jgi:PPOX class probable F420-dependent enzyme
MDLLRFVRPATTPPVRSAVPSRAEHRLQREPVVWLGTVDANGRPHLVPTWFTWDGESVWIFSKPEAVKVRNVRREPRVTLAVGDALDDFDVQLIEAVAEVPSARTAEVLADDHWKKYRRRLRNARISRQDYVETYSQPIRIRPTRFLPWHGRGPRWSSPLPAASA